LSAADLENVRHFCSSVALPGGASDYFIYLFYDVLSPSENFSNLCIPPVAKSVDRFYAELRIVYGSNLTDSV